MQIASESISAGPLAPPPNPASASVLIVDDSKLTRHVLSDLLREDGHRVIAVGEPSDALEILRSREFDLILLDLVLPGIEGHDFLERLLTEDATRDVPIIVRQRHRPPGCDRRLH